MPGYRLVGLVGHNQPQGGFADGGDIPNVGRLEDIEAICSDHDVAEVIVADRAADDPVYQRAALACLRRGCRVTNETTFYEKTYGEVPAAHIRSSWFLTADLKASERSMPY